MNSRQLGWLLLLALAVAGCRQRQLPAGFARTAGQTMPAPPLEKATFVHARGVTAEYGPNYKLVTIDPGGQDGRRYRYLLVQRGTPTPSGFADATVVTVPVRTYTVEIFGGLQRVAEDLSVEGGMTGISSFRGVQADMPRTAARVRAGEIVEVGGGAAIDLELILLLRPELVLADYTGSNGSFEPLRRIGVRPFVFANRLERSPLAAAEWLKILAMLFNREEAGNALFTGIERRYLELRRLAAGAPSRPQVLPFRMAADWWQDRAIDRQLVRDAGGEPVPADPFAWDYFHNFTYEQVLDAGKRAGVWPYGAIRWKNRRDIVASDARLAQFTAVQKDRVYHPGKLLAPRIVNPFYTSGYLYPDTILEDLIALLHPELLPGRELRYFQAVAP